MSATTHTPRETLRKTAYIMERVGVALCYAPDPIVKALHEHEQEPGNEWQRIETTSLLTDAAYYAHEDRPALVVYYDDEGDNGGFMFIEGHPDDAADSARHCAAQHRARAWWVVLTDERPEWHEVPR